MDKYLIALILFLVLIFPTISFADEFLIPASRFVNLAGKTGLDVSGGIPSSGWSNCVTSACNTLWGTAPGSITATLINNALSSAANSDTIVRLPAGNISISGNITLQSRTVLRGQGASGTIIDMNGQQILMTQTLTCDGTNLGSCSNRIDVDNEPISKGAMTISLDHTDSDFISLSAGDICLVYQDRPSYVTITSLASWVGWEPDTNHNVGHWMKVTSKNTENGDITFDSPLLMDLENGLDPEVLCIPQSSWKYRAGLENLKITDGGNAIGMILIKGCNECWIKGIETENAGNSNGSAHIRTERQGNFRVEIRDSYFHTGESPPYTGGENYAFLLMGFNSFWKIENNIIDDVRHTIVFEGPSAGMAVLYNYDYSHRQDDGYGQYDYIGQSMITHAYHPLNNLWEGDTTTMYGSDCQFGSASNSTWFRNYARGNKPEYMWVWGQWVIDFWQHQLYHNVIGNVLGNDADFNPGNYYQNDQSSEFGREPSIYSLGYANGGGGWGNTDTKTSLLRHMNYDYITNGTRTCDQEDEGCQGATHTNTDLADSLYYTSIPSSFWCTETPWPPIGPDVAGYVNDIPAKRRYNGTLCTLAGAPSDTTPPSAPTGVTVI